MSGLSGLGFGLHAEPTWLAAADFPRPEQAKAFTMPGDNGWTLTIRNTGTEAKFFGREPGLIRYWVLRVLGATAIALGIGR